MSRQAVIIPAYDSALVETEVISSLFSLFEKLQDFAIQGNTNIEYRLVGHIKVEGWGDRIPFEYDGGS